MVWRLSSALVIAVTVLGGCCHVSPRQQDAASVPNESKPADLLPVDRLYPGEALVLVIWEDPPQLPSRAEFMAVVQEDFTVTLLSNRVFTTTGKTREEFRQEVHDYYVPKLFKNVSLADTDPPIYFLRGEVQSPGLRVLFRPTTVLRAVELAGGFTSSANKKRLEVRRFNWTNSPYTSYTSTYVIDCEEAQRDPAADMEVQRNDVITVPRSLKRYWVPRGGERLTSGWSQ